MWPAAASAESDSNRLAVSYVLLFLATVAAAKAMADQGVHRGLRETIFVYKTAWAKSPPYNYFQYYRFYFFRHRIILKIKGQNVKGATR
jgi:hypothetical protein